MIPAKRYMAMALSFAQSKGMKTAFLKDQWKALAFYEIYGAILN